MPKPKTPAGARRRRVVPPRPVADASEPAPPAVSPSPPDSDVAAAWLPLDSLTPWADNPRRNEGRPVESVAESIRRFGWGRPLVTRQGTIVVGHTARLAALLLMQRYPAASEAERAAWHPEAIRTALTGAVPVRARDDLPEGEAHLLALADNRLGEFSEWDDRKVLEVLQRHDADAATTAGWNAEELTALKTKLADAILDGDDDPGDGGGDGAPRLCPNCGHELGGAP